jgi:deoxyhypusine synthase
MPRSNQGQRRKQWRDGTQDNLTPTEPLDLSAVKTVDDLVRQMGMTAFGGRCVGEAADVLETMVRDEDCFVVLTLSGAMTVAKMGLVICDLIDHGMVHAVVSTGATMAHGFVEASGRTHFKHEPGMNDRELYLAGYNRVYDTLELEKNLNEVSAIVSGVLTRVADNTVLSSRSVCERLGRWLARATREDQRGILKSAYEQRVPVYIPAFTDCELALDMGVYNHIRKARGRPPLRFDPFLDLEHFTNLLRRQKTLGILTVGGGVPRNWAQQVGPYLEILASKLGDSRYGGAFRRYGYGVRICPEPVHWGGLSGCTYSEGVSWGKFVPHAEGGRWAEVYADATIALPLIVKAVLERIDR